MKKHVGIIIENDENKILMQLRDDNTDLFPNTWVIPGGAVEKDETPEQAIRREIKEEIDQDMGSIRHFQKFIFDNEIIQHIFHTRQNLDPENLKLSEGRAVKFFSEDRIYWLDLGFNMKEIISEFFSEKQK